MEQYEKAVRLWHSWNVRTAADFDQYLDSFRILFAYHSGKIENNEITYNDTREIFETGKVVGYTGSPRALFEQQNQKLCYEAIKGKLAAREPLSVELIREIHRILTSVAYDEDKRAYYDALRQYDEAEALSPLVDFFKGQTAKTWRRALELAEGRTQERRGLSDLLREMYPQANALQPQPF